ncbi:hypothetical protein [Sphingobacterium chuzhouense]|nr:hypothetical protein [Sphingobacterium chuzhouense]
MENLSYINNNQLSQDQLIRIGDIVNFEGPLITLYQDRKYFDLYIFDWVDRDETTNRWLIYQVNAHALNRFLNREIPHTLLFESIPQKPIFVTDIHHGHTLLSSPIKEVHDIPKNYYPEETYFDKEDCPSTGKLKDAILDTITSSSLHNRLKHPSWIKADVHFMYTGSFSMRSKISMNLHESFDMNIGSNVEASYYRLDNINAIHLMSKVYTSAKQKENILDNKYRQKYSCLPV